MKHCYFLMISLYTNILCGSEKPSKVEIIMGASSITIETAHQDIVYCYKTPKGELTKKDSLENMKFFSKVIKTLSKL